jgi:hypothetical protein
MGLLSTITDFLSQKVSCLSTIPILVMTPIRRQPKRVKSLTKQLILFSGCLGLAGCAGSTYSSHFDCPLSTGIRCASLSEVNKMIDRRQINLGEENLTDTNAKNSPAGRQHYVYYGSGQLGRMIFSPDASGTGSPGME